mgnify:FL=1
MQRTIRDIVTRDGVQQLQLSCGHRQPAGAGVAVGAVRDCLRCERFEMPEDFIAYKRTPEFSETTVPAGLRRDHSTKPGVWARIHVLEGRLRYRCEALHADQELSAERPGVVVAEVLHAVEPLGAVRFYVEFHQAPASS